MEEPEPLPQILSNSGRRRTIGVSNSPEFEFCSNSFPRPNLLSADELFSGGVLLPLHHLRVSNDTPPPPVVAPDPESFGSDQAPTEPENSTTKSAQLSASSNTLPYSKRWRDIFRKDEKKSSRASVDIDAEDHCIKAKDIISSFREKRREKKTGGSGVSAAELNINLWPFLRSRSAGNSAARPRSTAAPAVRKVSSAPCSRSNSAAERSRKWPNSPGRGGVHLGRSSPVWQIRRRGGSGVRRSSEAVVRKDGNEGRRKIPLPDSGSGGRRSRTRVLSLSVPMCIGHRQQLGCRSEENSESGVAAGAGGRGGSSSEVVKKQNGLEGCWQTFHCGGNLPHQFPCIATLKLLLEPLVINLIMGKEDIFV